MFKIYRLYRLTKGTAYKMKPTEITFRARTHKEAMRKAHKFWIYGGFGEANITVKDEETIQLEAKRTYDKLTKNCVCWERWNYIPRAICKNHIADNITKLCTNCKHSKKCHEG